MGLFGVHVSFKMCIYVALALDDPHTKVKGMKETLEIPPLWKAEFSAKITVTHAI